MDDDIGNDLIDEIELPMAKAILVKAFRLAIAAEARSNVRALLTKAGMSLAQYRCELGPRIRNGILTPHGRPAEARSWPEGRHFNRRLQRALAASAVERVQLGELFQRARVEALH